MPQVGKKKYPYTKEGKAAAAKARQKQKRRGPMPKVNPEFAKEMEEANKPKQKAKDPHKEYKARQKRLEGIQRASDAAKMKETEGDTTGADLPITRQPLSMILRRRKAEREQAAREKARKDRKKRQGTIGAAPKKKTTQRKREQAAGKKKRLDPQSRHFRGRG